MCWWLCAARPDGGPGQGRLATHWSVPAPLNAQPFADPRLHREGTEAGICTQASLSWGLAFCRPPHAAEEPGTWDSLPLSGEATRPFPPRCRALCPLSPTPVPVSAECGRLELGHVEEAPSAVLVVIFVQPGTREPLMVNE